MWAPLCAALLASAAAGQDSDPRPTVTTSQGLVQGLPANSAGGELFYSFKGVPYARPPLGALRFQPPQRHQGWSGVLDASEHGSACAQFDFRENATRMGSEDCLFVNIYTRQLPGGNGSVGGLPVMVYVHGGGFFFGDGNSGALGPSYLMDEAVALVTFNYRLGVFGFLTTHDAAAPGNYGLLDQVLLLHWVQDNIAAFGGDPRQVTIFGESAGGASVSLLVLSPLTRGLFHHAISQSGAAISNFAAAGRRKGTALTFAKQLNCTADDAVLMVDCLRSVSEDDLMDASKALKAFFSTFMPRVDPEAARPFLPKDPRIILETGDFNLVPWISGLVEEEGAIFLQQLLADAQFAGGLLAGVPSLWGLFADLTTPSESPVLDCGADPAEELAKLLNFYAPNNMSDLPTLARVLSDRSFVAPTSEEIRLASAHAPVYKYVFDHRGAGRQSVTDGIDPPPPDLGVTHTEDLLYLFSSNDRPLARPGTPAHTMIRFMVSLWTSFARTGRPSSSVLEMPDWPIFTERSQRYMRLNSEPALGERLYEDRVNFWQTMSVNEPWKHPVQTTCETTKAVQIGVSTGMEDVTPSAKVPTTPSSERRSCGDIDARPCLAMDLLI